MIELYKFYKNDCAPCYSMSRNLIILEDRIPEDIKIIEKNVGIEESKLLAKSFGINKVPMLIFPHNKKMIGGKISKEEIIEFIVTKGGLDEVSHRTTV